MLGWLYWLNPVVALASTSRSWAPVDVLVLAVSVYALLMGASKWSSVLPVALLTFLNASTGLALWPFLPTWQATSAAAAALSIMAGTILHGKNRLFCTWGCHLWTMDLRANLGMWWYLMTEVFASFEPLFRIFMHTVGYLHIVPLRMRLPPPLSIPLAVAINTIMKPYPTAGDISFSLSLLAVMNQKEHELRWLVPINVTVASLLCYLLPLTWRQWMVQGNGNANFYFACTCLAALTQMLVVVSVLRHHLPKRLITQ